MICEECSKEGKTSNVYVESCSSTLLYSPPFYDEQGRYHDHDPNTVTTLYHCSNGHNFAHRSKPKCWCGYGGEG